MKIAMMSEHASPLAVLGGVDAGGQNVHVAALATALGRRGHDVVVYTRRDSPELPDRVPMAPGVVVEHLPAGPPCPVPKDELPPFVPELGRRLLERVGDQQADVLHAHFWMSGLASLAAAKATGVPVVQTFHALGVVKRRFQGPADTSPGNRIRHERALARAATRVVASCADERREVLRMGADPARVDIVPSGVDRTVFGPEGPAAARTARHRVLVVSRLVRRKGVDDAVRALARLDDAELVIAGGPEGAAFESDPEVARLRGIAAELAIDDRVRLLGSVPHAELAPWLRSADAVLCLPWYEPFGIVPLEAMACGVPVVAAAVGGLLDTVAHGVTGLHVPARDPDAAARALRTLFAEPATARRLGRAAVQRVRRYDWDEIAHGIERTYADAVHCGAGRPARQVAG